MLIRKSRPAPVPSADALPNGAALRRDIVAGLTAPARSLPCKLFYDDAGAHLFDRITQLDAYYPTRTELAILRGHAGEIARLLGPRCKIVEPGSGSGLKTRLLLEALEEPAAYVPVDISRAQLEEFAAALAAEMPWLEVLPVAADYTGGFDLPRGARAARRVAVFFPGSTIGNFEPADAERFLSRAAALVGPDGALLIGVDRKKDRATLELAYDDPEGVTAAFNLNILTHVNRLCGSDFDTAAFRHHAFYDAAAGRVEMHLLSLRRQCIAIPPGYGEPAVRIALDAGETIRTEHCYKYHPSEFAALAERAGWRLERVWTDPREWFAVLYLEPAGPRPEVHPKDL
ncbi:MAG TPA: L-histidine N(alpha)-methyltransferase [Longimicrobiales bacterium]|nr:L-histidine N(alpha)-methyltransferase [Longimicrobiales bacterium]